MNKELDKKNLVHLLDHWIEHNEQHVTSFNDWISKIEEAGFKDVAEEIKAASKSMETCTMYLNKAKEKIDE